jgi:outer membrane receptor protein involved in Fe transport
VNSLMIKRAVPAVLVFLTLCLPLAAEQTDSETITLEQFRSTGEGDIGPALTRFQPDVFSTANGSILIHGLPALTLLDGRRFPLSGGMGSWGMNQVDLFPVALLTAVDVHKVNSSPVYGTDAPGGDLNFRLNRDYYAGGEFGIFYGKSSGKYGREDFQSYIVGTVGNEHFSITAGAAYQDSSISIPRRSR